MSNGKAWDLTSPHSLEGACEWIRKNGGCLFVVAVRAGAKPDNDGRFVFDSAIAADPEMPIRDIFSRLELELPGLIAALMQTRERGTKGAREQRSHDRVSASQQTKR